MNIKYSFLLEEKAPKVIVEAMKLYGISEIVGKEHNPAIIGWAREVGLSKSYTSDETPWCGLFAAVVTFRAGFGFVENPLWARNWQNFGTPQKQAMLGDVLVFVRDGGGHVGFYVGEDKDCYHVLGGNQGNSVCVTRIKKTRCISIRRCDWKLAQPKNVRVIHLSSDGNISKNEQ